MTYPNDDPDVEGGWESRFLRDKSRDLSTSGPTCESRAPTRALPLTGTFSTHSIFLELELSHSVKGALSCFRRAGVELRWRAKEQRITHSYLHNRSGLLGAHIILANGI